MGIRRTKILRFINFKENKEYKEKIKRRTALRRC
jgi:hypothetical protein